MGRETRREVTYTTVYFLQRRVKLGSPEAFHGKRPRGKRHSHPEKEVDLDKRK